MIKFSVYLTFVFSTKICFGQFMFPIIEADYTFSQHGSNEHVIDKVWRFKDEIYTKLKTENHEYDLYRLSDSTFQVRMYKDDKLLEKGNILLKKENTVKSDTVLCHHCHPDNDWEELIFIYHYVRPIKIGRWKIIEENKMEASGFFNSENERIEYWKYDHKDSTVYYNHNSKEKYYYQPNDELVRNNIELIENEFYVSCNAYEENSITSIFSDLNFRFSIKLLKESDIDNSRSYLKINFKDNGHLEFSLISKSQVVFHEILKWDLTDKGILRMTNNQNEEHEYIFWTLGENKISLRHKE